MRAWVAAEASAVRRVWIELEFPGEGSSGPAVPHAPAPVPMALTAHLRTPDGAVHTRMLARCGYHPTLIVPDAEGVAAFVAITKI
jgi:hypothetical protein